MKKTHRVDMGTWHEKHENDRCYVCFAGSVMVKHLGADPDDMLHPKDFQGNAAQLEALNSFRSGSVSDGLANLGISVPVEQRPESRGITNYSDHKGKFKAQMRKLADELETFGL